MKDTQRSIPDRPAFEEIEAEHKLHDNIISEIMDEFFARGGYVSQKEMSEISRRIHLKHGIDLDERRYEPAENLP